MTTKETADFRQHLVSLLSEAKWQSVEELIAKSDKWPQEPTLSRVGNHLRLLKKSGAVEKLVAYRDGVRNNRWRLVDKSKVVEANVNIMYVKFPQPVYEGVVRESKREKSTKSNFVVRVVREYLGKLK